MKVVSRLLAIALLLVFACDTTLPALLADGESNLPACCRRDGKHHCAMMQMSEQPENTGQTWSTLSVKCPMFPRRSVASFIDQSAPPPVAQFAGAVIQHPVTKAQTEVLYRISHSRTRQKRGPPSLV
jgi:hypothetical protein